MYGCQDPKETMAKRAWVASSVFLALSAVFILGFFLESSNNQSAGSQWLHSTPKHRQTIGNDEKINNRHNDSVNGSTIRTHGPCKAQTQIVFVKTHKTASSTTAGIIDTFAYKNNLTMAVPQDDQPYMHHTELFRQDMVRKTSKSAEQWRRNVGFNIMSSHARYNKLEMDAVVHNAKYITILRDPATQFASAFVYFKFHTRFERKFGHLGRRYANVLEEFMKNPAANMKLCENHQMVHVLHNQQFFDLGMDTKYANDWDAIDASIAKFDRELDLVMIKEYFDESLILLRDLLCWSTEDILYISRKAYNSSTLLTVKPETQQKIRQWNAADMHLYEHYNKTFWQRIDEYGPNFEHELRKFRLRLQSVTEDDIGSHRKVMRQLARKMQDMDIYL